MLSDSLPHRAVDAYAAGGGRGSKLGAGMPELVLAAIGIAAVWSLAALWLRRGAARQERMSRTPAPQAPQVPLYPAQPARPPVPAATQDPYPPGPRVRETYTVGGDPSGVLVLLAFAALSLAGAIVSVRTHTQSSNLAVVLFTGLPILVLVFGAAALLRRRRLPRRLVLRGQVTRLWTVMPDAARGTGGRTGVARGSVAGNGGPRNPVQYYCVLYCPQDGERTAEGVRLKLNQTVYQRLHEGGLIEVLVDPRRHRIKDLRTVEGPG